MTAACATAMCVLGGVRTISSSKESSSPSTSSNSRARGMWCRMANARARSMSTSTHATTSTKAPAPLKRLDVLVGHGAAADDRAAHWSLHHRPPAGSSRPASPAACRRSPRNVSCSDGSRTGICTSMYRSIATEAPSDRTGHASWTCRSPAAGYQPRSPKAYRRAHSWRADSADDQKVPTCAPLLLADSPAVGKTRSAMVVFAKSSATLSWRAEPGHQLIELL